MTRQEAYQRILGNIKKDTKSHKELRELFEIGLVLLEDFHNQVGSIAFSLSEIVDHLRNK